MAYRRRTFVQRGHSGVLAVVIVAAVSATTLCFVGSTGPFSGEPHRKSLRTPRHYGSGGNRPSHSDVASKQMPKMPTAPSDPLEWSVDKVKEADFMSSAVYAGSLCRTFEAGGSSDELQSRLAAMLGHSDGARGFFVTYLTDPKLKTVADAPEGIPQIIQTALQNSNADVVSPLAVMNLAMSTATGLSHKAKGDVEKAANSELTARRSAKVLEVLLSSGSDAQMAAATRKKLEAARAAADDESSDKEWTAFYSRWGYNDEQMEAVRSVLDTALASKAA
eukprot:TRINITY_DN5301_c3_g1_i1.p1 TRINITY_DN5301_c3_g1~~TRINITY_DN5301_c3_g1_i1.p1  ORF type:complete len:278 (+),score=60.01 TRINITY_DN5301_c3_g1_i1:141-974(+)